MTKTTEVKNGIAIMGILKQYWFIIAVILTLLVRGAIVENIVAGNSKKSDNNTELLQQLVKIQSDMNGQLTVILNMLGVKASDSTIGEWKKMPRTLPLDENKKPVDEAEWLCVTDKYYTGLLMRWHEGDSIMVKELWRVKGE